MKGKKILLHYGIPLSVGALAALVCRNYFDLYKNLQKPPLAPPTWVFPVAWTLLYGLMGYSTYRLSRKSSGLKVKKQAYMIYGIQLALNFLWTPAFFVWRNFLVALIVLIFMYFFIWLMMESFKEIDRFSGRIQIPYLLWSTFALYLNLATMLMNPM